MLHDPANQAAFTLLDKEHIPQGVKNNSNINSEKPQQ